MALATGEYLSGGEVYDVDGRRVVGIDGSGGGAISVASTPQTANTLAAGATTATGGASAVLVAANSSRKGLQVVVDTAATASVYLLLGAGTASATNFHVVLSGGGSWDGIIGQTVWTGAVQAFSSGTPKIGVAEV